MFWELVGVCQMGIEWWHWIGNLILTDHQIRQSFPNPTPSNEYQSIALHISNVFPQRKSFMWNLMWAFSHWMYWMHHICVTFFATFLFQTGYIQCSSSCSVYYRLAPVYRHYCSVYYTHTQALQFQWQSISVLLAFHGWVDAKALIYQLSDPTLHIICTSKVQWKQHQSTMPVSRSNGNHAMISLWLNSW